MTAHHAKISPTWLVPLWKRRKTKTVTRVKKAIKALVRAGLAPSLRAIAKQAEAMDGLPLSPNTIYKNAEAYEAYRQHTAKHPVERRRSQALKAVEQCFPADQRQYFAARLQYLRRLRKDDLIAQLLQHNLLLKTRDQEATLLRDEILRLQARLHAKK